MIDALRNSLNTAPNTIHLNNAGISPLTKAAQEAINAATSLRAEHGTFAIPELLARYAQARASHARLLDIPSEQLAFFQTCASAITQVALGIPWTAGDEVILWDQEYPSNAYPWFEAARQFDLKLVTLKSGDAYETDTQKVLEAIGPRTKAVALSWVQFQTGSMVDTTAIVEACRQHSNDIWVVLDAIQGLGVIPFSQTSLDVDAVCGGSHKWLLGPLGHGFLGLKANRVRELRPILHGAMTYGTTEDRPAFETKPRSDIQRFEPGVPHLHGALGSAASIEILLSVGIEAIHSAASANAKRLREGLIGSHFEVLPGSQQSPIVTFRPRDTIENASAALNHARISHAAGRANGIRLAPHAFNSSEEMDQTVAALIAPKP